jgi:hypothetical protein
VHLSHDNATPTKRNSRVKSDFQRLPPLFLPEGSEMKCVSQVFRSAMREFLASGMRQLEGTKTTIRFKGRMNPVTAM